MLTLTRTFRRVIGRDAAMPQPSTRATTARGRELETAPIDAFYRAAAEIGGDFYDFIPLPDGKLGLVVGDVTGHGVPAALVMATTRSVLRSEAPRLVAPGKVLERVNDFLHSDIPANMFVTCLYAVLDPKTGALRYANAGHDLPFVRRGTAVEELRATGMPLGAMAGMRYDEHEATLGE